VNDSSIHDSPDKIPIYSLDAYMLDKETGYIKLNKFAATTDKEFSDAVVELKKNKMQNLVLDLRGNGGGYMLAATALADKFFSDKKLLVYISGRKTPRQDHDSDGSGPLSTSRVVVLTDEGSASASEILARHRTGTEPLLWEDVPSGKVWCRMGFSYRWFDDRMTIAEYTPSGSRFRAPTGCTTNTCNFYKQLQMEK
jgi:hypothetical protein